MSKYYKKHERGNKFFIRTVALVVCCVGLLVFLYTFFPLLSWHIYFSASASSGIESPIPKATIVDATSIKSLVSGLTSNLSGVDYTNAQNWFPGFKNGQSEVKVRMYNISVPKLKIPKADVSTADTDLASHLVHYGGTSLPGEKGNAVIFGHSTLPQLFNPNDYKTIFAKAYTLQAGDEIFATVSNVSYRYKITSIMVVEPTDTSIFTQNYNDSYLTLVTCTPPGTTWKRLIIRAKLQTL